MGFDWKKLEREDQANNDRVAFAMGLTHCGIALIGVIFALVTGSSTLSIMVVWYMIIGTLLLALWIRRRRQQRRNPSDQQP